VRYGVTWDGWDTGGLCDWCISCSAGTAGVAQAVQAAQAVQGVVLVDTETGAVAWLNVAGLLLDLAGAAVLAWGLFIDEDDALRLGLAMYSFDEHDEPDEQARRKKNLALPAVEDRLRQSRNAKRGLGLIAVGIVLQIVSNWP